VNSRTLARYVKVLKSLSKKSEISEKSKSRLEKEAKVRELSELLMKYRTLCIIDLNNMPTQQFKELKRILSNYGVVRVVKNSLLARALEDLKLRNYEEVIKYLSGSNAILLTNLNAFEIFRICERLKSKRYAKPGDTATSEVVIPSGPTNIPPGPSLSMFGKLKISTQVREGFIWIAKDVTVAKPGDKISNELASLLRKLDIKVIDVGLKIKLIYDEGLVFTKPEKLRLNITSFKNDLLSSVRRAIDLATALAIPLPEVIPSILSKAYNNALVLSAEAGIISRENIHYVLSRAISKAVTLASIISTKTPELGIAIKPQAEQPTKPSESKPVEASKESTEVSKEEKKEVSEEELAEGLSSLFG